MGRIIGAVVVGYLAMFAFVFATFTAAFLTMGTDRAFQPGSFDVSGLWLVVSFVLGFIAAVIGGWIAGLIGRSQKAVKSLAVLVLVLGFLMAIPVLMADKSAAPKVRTGDLANMEAMMSGVQPTWVALLNPIIGAAGVFVGGGTRRKGG